jgi:hypothetical protein
MIRYGEKNVLSYLHDLNWRGSLLCIIIVLKYLMKYFNINVSLSNIYKKIQNRIYLDKVQFGQVGLTV